MFGDCFLDSSCELGPLGPPAAPDIGPPPLAPAGGAPFWLAPLTLLLAGPLGGQEGGPPFAPGPIIPAELLPPLFALLAPPLVEEPRELKSSASSSPFVPVAALGSY